MSAEPRREGVVVERKGHVAVDLMPGLALVAAFAVLAMVLRYGSGIVAFSPILVAVVFGILFRAQFGVPASAEPGARFTRKVILRLAIVLLGFQLSLSQLIDVGTIGIAIIVIATVATFLFTKWFGWLIGAEQKLSELLAAGTAICGASAVMAMNTVTRARDDDAAYAVAVVTLFGSISMFLYPVLAGLLSLDARAYGLWTGASVHEVAQVVAAAFHGGQVSGEFGTVVKLGRVALLAPLVLAVAFIGQRHMKQTGQGAGVTPFPWFIAGFLAAVALNTVFPLAADIKAMTFYVTAFLLSMALAAVGLDTNLSMLKAKGMRPLLVGAASSVFISLVSLLLITLFRW